MNPRRREPKRLKLAPKRVGMYTPPEVKANRTKGLPMAGRVTLEQYLLLVDRGYDGEQVQKWTKYRASKEIAKILKR